MGLDENQPYIDDKPKYEKDEKTSINEQRNQNNRNDNSTLEELNKKTPSRSV